MAAEGLRGAEFPLAEAADVAPRRPREPRGGQIPVEEIRVVAVAGEVEGGKLEFKIVHLLDASRKTWLVHFCCLGGEE